MDNVGSWVRQARHRAKRYGVLNDLLVSEAREIITAYSGQCAYCDRPATTLDHPIAISARGPHAPANVLPCCARCKEQKRGRSIMWLFEHGKLSQDCYLRLLGELFTRRGAEALKAIIREEVGIITRPDDPSR